MRTEETLMEALGIEVTSVDQNLVTLTMPVDHRTRQPAGYLHGGASVALAETAASIGASLHVDLEHYLVFGIEINANHIKSMKEGQITAQAIPHHVGKTTQVWEIKLTSESDQLICVSRCTIGVVPKNK